MKRVRGEIHSALRKIKNPSKNPSNSFNRQFERTRAHIYIYIYIFGHVCANVSRNFTWPNPPDINNPRRLIAKVDRSHVYNNGNRGRGRGRNVENFVRGIRVAQAPRPGRANRYIREISLASEVNRHSIFSTPPTSSSRVRVRARPRKKAMNKPPPPPPTRRPNTAFSRTRDLDSSLHFCPNRSGTSLFFRHLSLSPPLLLPSFEIDTHRYSRARVEEREKKVTPPLFTSVR